MSVISLKNGIDNPENEIVQIIISPRDTFMFYQIEKSNRTIHLDCLPDLGRDITCAHTHFRAEAMHLNRKYVLSPTRNNQETSAL